MSEELLPIRVWQGFALPAFKQKNRPAFYSKLGSVFMPATVQDMQPWGLIAYLPTALPPFENPDMPDEIALVCYESTEAYNDACKKSVAGRGYSLLHHSLFSLSGDDPPPFSHSGFPSLYQGRLDEDNYTLWPFNQWQEGATTVQLFQLSGELSLIEDELLALQHDKPASLRGVIVAKQKSALTVWSNWQPDATAQMIHFSTHAEELFSGMAEPIGVPLDGTSAFEGVPVQAGTFYNFNFDPRR